MRAFGIAATGTVGVSVDQIGTTQPDNRSGNVSLLITSHTSLSTLSPSARTAPSRICIAAQCRAPVGRPRLAQLAESKLIGSLQDWQSPDGRDVRC